MSLRNIFLVVYLLISSVLFISFNCDIYVWLTFFLSFLIITLITYYHLFIEIEYSPFISAFIVFNYLFFLLAPIIQIGSFTVTNNKFATRLPYDTGLTIKTNGLIILFNIIFFFTYVYFKRKYRKKILKVVPHKKEKNLPLTLLVLFLITLVVLYFSIDFMMDEISRPSWLKSTYSVFENGQCIFSIGLMDLNLPFKPLRILNFFSSK